jgi:CSLREA domain-containing protein
MKTRILRFLLLIALVFSALMPTTTAHAAGFAVTKTADTADGTCDADCSLREAIIAANAAAGDDTITVPAGTYTLTIAGIGEDAAATGDLDLTSNITINGAGADSTIIQAGTLGVGGPPNGIDRVFHVTVYSTVNIYSVTVRNGNTVGFGGGGIYQNNGILTITNSAFSGNSAWVGGGIYNNIGTLTVTNSTVSGNNSANGAGGIYNNGTLDITNSTFSGNSATGGSAGGGIAIVSGTLTITNSTFSGNSADSGGGIYTNGGITTITNSTVSGNSAATGGGGIYQSLGTVTLRNTIVANSTAGGDCSGTVTDGGNNIVEDNTCGFTGGADPNLGALTGSPAYFPLLSGSPAIDTGDDAVCAAAPVSNTSQNGIPRPQGAHCDIGSYEAYLTLTLNSAGANDGWILESTETSNAGGTLNSSATTFNLGDNAQDKQYRAILHFNTAGLPNAAVIAKATLEIKKQGLVGTDPFTALGLLRVDMRKPFFGTTVGLLIGDFQATAGKSSVATFDPTPVGDWYSALLNATGMAYINKTGTTQFRLRFATGDNDNSIADYMKFFSGNYATASDRPTLIIEYYMP